MIDKLADIQALMDHITALSTAYKMRISAFTVPPNGNERFIHVSMGFTDSVDISGYGDDLTVIWMENGTRRKAKYKDLIGGDNE